MHTDDQPETALGNPWLKGSAPGGGIARAWVRSDADRAEIERHQPASLLPASTIHGCIRAAAAIAPDKVAIIHMETTDPDVAPRHVSYRELVDGIERAACLFAEASEASVPIVSVISPVHPDALMAMWGAEAVGVVNPINPFLDADGVVSIMNSIGSNVLVIATPAFGAGAWDRLDDIASRVPSLRRVFLIGAGEGDDRAFSAALARESGREFGQLRLRLGAEDSTYMPTGGTTGAPKMVRHTQERQLLNAWLMGALNGSSTDEVVGHGMPNFHVGGLVCTCLRAAIFGQTLVILTPDGFRNPKVVQGFWDIARRFDITNVIATPTTAAALHADPKADHVGHRIHTFSCGGSTIPTELLHAFHRRFGLYLRELWGMTEFHGVTTGHPNDGSQPAIGSVGRRFAYHQVKAALLEDGRFVREAAPGEKGILIASGACIGDGYLPEAMSEQLFVKGMPDGEVWATTGDIGTVDETGHVWVHGREKDLIVRGAHKIDPRVIEEVLQQHPAVQLSAAIGQPHATRGEMPIAYVQPRTNAQVSADELIAFCKERIVERAAVPVEITLLPAMPMTAVGKIAKPALRLDALKRVAQDVAIRAIGVDSLAGIRVDESGKRPTVIVAVRAAAEHAAEVEDKLRSAFMGFEFDVRAEILPVRETA